MLLCEPNVSEGRDAQRIARFVAAVRGAGVELLHASADPDHHRLVLAYRGAPDPVLAATRALAEAVFAEVDLREHRGEHPRIGALDVVPFVRGPGTSERQALETCRAFGRWAGERGVPVFYYERAASRPERRALPVIRAGQFERLAEKMEQPDWAPDEGPSAPHPRAGAVAVGVRAPLVRFNVNLATADPEAAHRIAAAVREAGGGLPGVRALGIRLERRRLTQVSMNLTRPRATSLMQAWERVSKEAERLGVGVAGSEIIGPVPGGALAQLAREALGAELDDDQVIELEDLDQEEDG